MTFRKLLLLATVTILGLHARVARATEVCGDGLDNDSDLMTDEGCAPAAITGVDENPLDPAHTGSVAPKSGGVTYAVPPDVDIVEPFGPALTFRRTYQSLYEPGGSAPAYRTPLGPHWSHNFMSWLDKNTTPNPDQVILHTTDNRDVLFQYDSTAGGYDYYVAQEGYHVDYLRQATSSPYGWELRTLTGTVYAYNWTSPTGKLVAIKDSLATPNALTITYNANGQVDRVLDASGKKELNFFYTGSVLTTLQYATVNGSTHTSRVVVSYTYTSGNPTAVAIGAPGSPPTVQTMSYISGYLTAITDAYENTVVAFAYLASSPGKLVRSTSEVGGLGFDYVSSACSGGTVVYFNQIGTTVCDADADCGSDRLCGGQTTPGTGNTGLCYLAARCVQVTSPDEDLVDTVTALPNGTCSGACAPRTEYDWLSTPDLAGVKEADGTWTSYQRNSDGLVTLMARGDTDSNPANASSGQLTWYFYSNASFPGRITESRKVSELKAGGSYNCDGSTATDCARTLYTWNSDGLLGSQQDLGFTRDASGATVSYSYTTGYSYDSHGRRTQVDGPLSGTNDVTDYTFWSSSDVLQDGYRKEVKRKKDTTSYVVTTYDGYGYRGLATSVQDPDGTYTCSTYDVYGRRTEERVAMAGQTSCATVDGTDLRTYFTYDLWGRLTKTQRPLGNCEHRAYDTKGRLATIKERDDCNAASSGDTIEYSYLASAIPTDQVTVISLKDAAGATKREYDYTYHDGMQLAQDINPVNKSYLKSYAYNADGLLAQVDDESSLGKTGWYWDSLNRQDEVDRYKTSSTFDSWIDTYAAQFGQPIQVEDDEGKSLYTDWDDRGLKVQTISPDAGTTRFVYDAARNLVTKVEAAGAAGEVTHTFTYDNLGRRLTEDYGTENCGAGQPVDITYAYDSSPVTCPSSPSGTCALETGRLAYVRSTLLCSNAYADHTLDQEVFYAYDAGGRLIQEYYRDDSGRTAIQSYTYDKNGNALRVTAPDGTYSQATRGGTGNSDADKVTTLANGAGNLATNIAWLPYGPISGYTQSNNYGGSFVYPISTTLSWNKAYRPASVLYNTSGGANLFQIGYTEDAKGRTTVRDYSYGDASLQDSYLQYDNQNRLLCDGAVSGTCPTSGANLRSNISGSPPYTPSGNRVQLLHNAAGYGSYTYTYTYRTGKNQLDYFTSSPSTGTTSFGWDDRGERTSDNSTAYAHDARSYTYDGRGNIRQITGETYVAGTFRAYTITNAYDHKGRRVFKSFASNGNEAQWFFYYDLRDRLIQVKHTPQVSSPSSYSLYSFFYIETRPLAYYQVDYPGTSTTRRYIHSDALDQPIEAWSWPASGSASRVWVDNPDFAGWDIVVVGSAVYQPLRGRRGASYHDAETVVCNDSGGLLRPEISLIRRSHYDPLLLSILSSVHASGTPAGFAPTTPIAIAQDRPERTPRMDSSDDGQGRNSGGFCHPGYSIDADGDGCHIDDENGLLTDDHECGYRPGTGKCGGTTDPGWKPPPGNPNCNAPNAGPGDVCNEGGDPPTNLTPRDPEVCESLCDAAGADRWALCIDSSPEPVCDADQSNYTHRCNVDCVAGLPIPAPLWDLPWMWDELRPESTDGLAR